MSFSFGGDRLLKLQAAGGDSSDASPTSFDDDEPYDEDLTCVGRRRPTPPSGARGLLEDLPLWASSGGAAGPTEAPAGAGGGGYGRAMKDFLDLEARIRLTEERVRLAEARRRRRRIGAGGGGLTKSASSDELAAGSSGAGDEASGGGGGGRHRRDGGGGGHDARRFESFRQIVGLVESFRRRPAATKEGGGGRRKAAAVEAAAGRKGAALDGVIEEAGDARQVLQVGRGWSSCHSFFIIIQSIDISKAGKCPLAHFLVRK